MSSSNPRGQEREKLEAEETKLFHKPRVKKVPDTSGGLKNSPTGGVECTRKERNSHRTRWCKATLRSFIVLKIIRSFERFYAWSTMTPLYFCLITPDSEHRHQHRIETTVKTGSRETSYKAVPVIQRIDDNSLNLDNTVGD